MARQGADAVAVRLGSLFGQPQAHLDGFKSRALRSEASTARHLYLTEWRSLDAATAQSGATLVIGSESWTAERERLSPSALRHKLAAMVGEDWAVIVATVAMERKCFAALPLFALEVALALVQVQAAIACAPAVWLLSRVMQMPGQPEHAGSWGLARSARAEASQPVQYIDGAATMVVKQHWALAEVEAVMRHDARLVPRLARAHQAAHTTMAPAASAHVVTGGTGGLGLLTARWLAQRGDARTLALASRSGVLARGSVVEWKGLHATSVATLVQRCDMAEGAHVGRLMAHVTGAASGMGVWHAAGVLADGVLPGQTAERLARVYAPKAHGAWALHCAFSRAVVRTHALFSSVAALLGGAGQANYSAANACLDALGSYRRTCARAAMSVQWGAWAEVGMAARGAAAERMAAMETASGFGRLGLAQGLGALHAAVLPRASSLVGVVPVQWGRMLRDGAVPAFLSSMAAPALAKEGSVATVEQRAACAISSLEAVLEMVRRTAGGSVDADAPLMEAGVDSLGAVELRNQLQRAVGDGVALSSTLMFDHPTARQVAVHLRGPEPSAADIGDGNVALASACEHVEVVGRRATLPMCVSELREMSHCGRDLLCVIPLSRWDVEQAALDLVGAPPEVASRVRHGGCLCNAELFEHGFFRISAAEAAAMDPQQRQLLECGYSALHSAGLSKVALLGAVVGVSIGQWQSEFGSVLLGTPAGSSVYASTGFSCSVTCGRVSFVLGLQGPCASYDTACSASLVANHGSVRALQRIECASALSAGVNMILEPSVMRGNAVAGFTSVKGRSHTFDARADGYARGEAIDVVACRLGTGNEAVASFASMAGSTIRQDGRSASLTAPNGQAQQGVLGASLVDARVEASEIAALEAHGTGTALGDPIEAGAVAAVFLAYRGGLEESLRIGSLKANAGHTEPGAGLAGALKLLMQLRDSSLSPNAQLRTLNPHVDGALSAHAACGLPTQVTQKVPRTMHMGGVSSFGYAGTIAHAVLAFGGGGDREALAFGRAPDASDALAFGSRGAEVAGGGVPARCSEMEAGRSTFERRSRLLLLYRRHAFPWRDAPHPLARHSLASSDGSVVFRSPAKGQLHAVVADHVVQGRVIFPGAGYLEMARAAVGAALHDIFFLQPLTVESANLLIECAVFDGSFEVRSGEAEAVETALTVHCSGAMTAGGKAWRRVDHAPMRAPSRAVDVGALYDGFDAIGLQYGPGYRTLAQAWGGVGTALARLRARSTHEGTQVHPADLDDALCTSGAMASSGREGDETRLPFAVDDALLQGAPLGELWAVRALHSPIHHPAPVALLTDSTMLARLGVAGSGAARGRCGRSAAWQSFRAAASAARRLQVAGAAIRGVDGQGRAKRWRAGGGKCWRGRPSPEGCQAL